MALNCTNMNFFNFNQLLETWPQVKAGENQIRVTASWSGKPAITDGIQLFMQGIGHYQQINQSHEYKDRFEPHELYEWVTYATKIVPDSIKKIITIDLDSKNNPDISEELNKVSYYYRQIRSAMNYGYNGGLMQQGHFSGSVFYRQEGLIRTGILWAHKFPYRKFPGGGWDFGGGGPDDDGPTPRQPEPDSGIKKPYFVAV